MKRVFRALLFSASALLVTAYYNKGFIIHNDAVDIIKSVLLVAVFYFVVVPAARLLLTPLNILTLGFASLVSYFALFYFLVVLFPFIKIQPWTFNGFAISYLGNMVISAFSIALIINLLDHLL